MAPEVAAPTQPAAVAEDDPVGAHRRHRSGPWRPRRLAERVHAPPCRDSHVSDQVRVSEQPADARGQFFGGTSARGYCPVLADGASPPAPPDDGSADAPAPSAGAELAAPP